MINDVLQGGLDPFAIAPDTEIGIHRALRDLRRRGQKDVTRRFRARLGGVGSVDRLETVEQQLRQRDPLSISPRVPFLLLGVDPAHTLIAAVQRRVELRQQSRPFLLDALFGGFEAGSGSSDQRMGLQRRGDDLRQVLRLRPVRQG